MMVHFHSWEAAIHFVLERRNEGYFAEICESNVPFFWGPNAVGGFRVITSEEAGDDEQKAAGTAFPAAGIATRILSKIASLTFWSAIALVISMLMLTLIPLFLANPFSVALTTVLLSIAGALALVLVTFVSLISEAVTPLIRRRRNLPLKLALGLLVACLCLAVAAMANVA